MKEHLHHKVERILRRYGFTDIRVRPDSDRQVVLSGTVADFDERAMAIAIARTTPGVQEIENEINIAK
ncbi:MAG: transport-associated domain protein [Anaerolineaceae bacterium]|nr:transport-associated domain protein [Anaerolineaceae bacterium]